ncbi:MAG: metallophosphoesterase [bacterium]
MSKLSLLIFLSIVSTIYFGMHFYVYTRIVSGLMLSAGFRVWLRIAFLVLGMSFFVGEFLSRKYTSVWIRPVEFVGATWLGVISMALAIFIICDIVRIFYRGEDVRYYITIAGLVLLALVSAYSLYNGMRRPVVRNIDIKMSKLPDELSGFSVVQLSDLHLNYTKSREWLEDIVNRTNELNPDIIVITGDLIDADICKFEEVKEILKKLKARHGVFAVTGNHEFYAGVEVFMDIAEAAGITVLRNSHVTIADKIELAGLDDGAGRHRSGSHHEGPNLYKALDGVDLTKPVIMLSHMPDIFNNSRKMGVDLQLSGHTHAGQIPPMDLIVMFRFDYPYGLYKRDSSYIYTTSGTGTWGPPVRLFSRSEIVRFILSK